MGVLGRLCEQAIERADALKPRLNALRRAALETTVPPSLEEALRAGTAVQVIAEIKRRSPSKGAIAASLDAPAQARAYASGGAAALSVLTEPESFGGTNDDLVAVRRATNLPVLKKDFHVDPVQVWEARSIGASALLLIARALGPEGIARMTEAAGEAGIEALYEVRDEQELEWSLEAGARLVGVNRRDLETLALEDDVPASVIPKIPGQCLAIAESGIHRREDVAAAAGLGADAVLVGSALSSSAAPAGALQDLCGVARGGRRG